MSYDLWEILPQARGQNTSNWSIRLKESSHGVWIYSDLGCPTEHLYWVPERQPNPENVCAKLALLVFRVFKLWMEPIGRQGHIVMVWVRLRMFTRCSENAIKACSEHPGITGLHGKIGFWKAEWTQRWLRIISRIIPRAHNSENRPIINKTLQSTTNQICKLHNNSRKFPWNEISNYDHRKTILHVNKQLSSHKPNVLEENSTEFLLVFFMFFFFFFNVFFWSIFFSFSFLFP